MVFVWVRLDFSCCFRLGRRLYQCWDLWWNTRSGLTCTTAPECEQLTGCVLLRRLQECEAWRWRRPAPTTTNIAVSKAAKGHVWLLSCCWCYWAETPSIHSSLLSINYSVFIWFWSVRREGTEYWPFCTLLVSQLQQTVCGFVCVCMCVSSCTCSILKWEHCCHCWVSCHGYGQYIGLENVIYL